MPTRNNWPTRWASVMPAKTWAGQEGNADRGDNSPALGRGEASLPEVGEGFPAATTALVELAPHPELASPSKRADAERTKVRRRRVIPL